MNLNKITSACAGFVLSLTAHGNDFDISGQLTANNGSPISGVKVSLSVPSVSGAITGRLTNAQTGLAIAGAQVFIDSKPEINGQSPAIAVTDSDGHYTLGGLDEGIYTIGMWKRGFETQYQMNVAVIAGFDSVQHLTTEPVMMSEDKIVLIRAEFNTVKFHPDHDAAWAEQMFFDDTPGAASIRNFFYQLSHGRMDLKQGANVLVNVSDPDLQYPHENSDRDDIVDYAINASKSLINYNDPSLDVSANWDHKPGGDGRIDNVVVITAGLPKSITGSRCDMNPVSMLNSEYVTSNIRTSVQALLPEYSPLGNMAHEVFHSMGETAVQDLYIGGTCDVNDELSTPLGMLGKWGTMGIGMYNKLDTFLSDPRGSDCEVGYIDPCADEDGFCTTKMFGEQPALPTPWTMWKWYHKYFWKQGVLDVQRVEADQNKTIRLYPYSTSNGTQVVIVPKSSGQWWSITNRQPIGFDKGLEHSDGEGQTGIVIDYNDPSLAGRMQLRGPVRVRDSHPGTLPDYTHYACRARLDDAAFNIGEVESYQEDQLNVQLLEEHADGSITVQIANNMSLANVSEFNSSQRNASSVLPVDVAIDEEVEQSKIFKAITEQAPQDHDDNPHEYHTHDHQIVTLEVKPGIAAITTTTTTATVPKTPYTKFADPHSINYKTNILSASPLTDVGSQVESDVNGYYLFDNVPQGSWQVSFDACGYASTTSRVEVFSNTLLNRVLTADSSRTITAQISSPLTGSTVGSVDTVALQASGSSFGQTSYLWESDIDGVLSSVKEDAVMLSVGTHLVTLTMANALCSDQVSTQINVVAGPVNQLPSAEFNWSTNGLSVDFSDDSTDIDGYVVGWTWDFGDGATASTQNPQHQYDAAGDYHVTLSVTDDAGGQQSISKMVTVEATPADPYQLQNGVAKTPLTVAYQAEAVYHIQVPAGVSSMTINLSGDGDGDLYVKHASEPTRDYGGADHKSTKWRSNESLTISNPSAGIWYIMVYGYGEMTTGSLRVDF